MELVALEDVLVQQRFVGLLHALDVHHGLLRLEVVPVLEEGVHLGHAQVGIVLPFDFVKVEHADEDGPVVYLILDLHDLLLTQDEGLGLGRDGVVCEAVAAVALGQLLDFLVALVPLDSQVLPDDLDEEVRVAL